MIMSKTYRIKLGAQELTLHGNKLQLPIILASLLPEPEMKELLRQQLESSSEWSKADQGWKTDTGNHTSGKINEDLDTLTIQSEEREIKTYEEALSPQARAKADRGETLSEEDIKGYKLGDNVIAHAVAEARSRLNHVLGSVYKEAVLIKARELGSVESIEESETEEGSRVRIRVQG